MGKPRMRGYLTQECFSAEIQVQAEHEPYLERDPLGSQEQVADLRAHFFLATWIHIVGQWEWNGPRAEIARS